MEILALLGLSEIDSLANNLGANQLQARANAAAAKLSQLSQAEIDAAYSALSQLPNTEQFTGMLKEAVRSAHDKANKRVTKANRDKAEAEAKIAEATTKVDHYHGKSAIGKLLDFGESKRNANAAVDSLESMTRTKFSQGVENKA